MPDLHITSPDGLVKSTIKSKQETYYLVTEHNLKFLSEKGILSDLFKILASLCWGFFVSLWITITSNLNQLKDGESIPEFINTLQAYKTSAFVGAIICTLLAIVLYNSYYKQIREIKSRKVETE